MRSTVRPTSVKLPWHLTLVPFLACPGCNATEHRPENSGQELSVKFARDQPVPQIPTFAILVSHKSPPNTPLRLDIEYIYKGREIITGTNTCDAVAL